MSSIFLAHSSKDKTFARLLANELQERGVTVWLDEDEIQVGDSIVRMIENGIDEMNYLGVILSPESVESGWVKREVEIGLSKEINSDTVIVLPILYKHCSIPPFLKQKLYADFTSKDSFQKALGLLLSRLQEQGNDSILLYGWPIKAVRYGLKIGLLDTKENSLTFKSDFFKNLRDVAAEYLRGETEDLQNFGEIVARAAAETLSNSDGTEKTLPLDAEQLTYLLNEIVLQMIKIMYDLGVRTKTMTQMQGGLFINPSLEEEVLEELPGLLVDVEAHAGRERCIFADLLIEVIEARLALRAPIHRGFAPVIAALFYDHRYWSLVEGLEQRAWDKPH